MDVGTFAALTPSWEKLLAEATACMEYAGWWVARQWSEATMQLRTQLDRALGPVASLKENQPL